HTALIPPHPRALCFRVPVAASSDRPRAVGRPLAEAVEQRHPDVDAGKLVGPGRGDETPDRRSVLAQLARVLLDAGEVLRSGLVLDIGAEPIEPAPLLQMGHPGAAPGSPLSPGARFGPAQLDRGTAVAAGWCG